jgi:hypothetical protein
MSADNDEFFAYLEEFAQDVNVDVVVDEPWRDAKTKDKDPRATKWYRYIANKSPDERERIRQQMRVRQQRYRERMYGCAPAATTQPQPRDTSTFYRALVTCLGALHRAYRTLQRLRADGCEVERSEALEALLWAHEGACQVCHMARVTTIDRFDRRDKLLTSANVVFACGACLTERTKKRSEVFVVRSTKKRKAPEKEREDPSPLDTWVSSVMATECQ